GTTRSTCVCCAITSETRIAYGSRVRRQGSSRPLSAYQSRRSPCTSTEPNGASRFRLEHADDPGVRSDALPRPRRSSSLRWRTSPRPKPDSPLLAARVGEPKRHADHVRPRPATIRGRRERGSGRWLDGSISRFGRSYTGEPDRIAEELAHDEAV